MDEPAATDLVVIVPGLDAKRYGQVLERVVEALTKGLGGHAFQLATRQGEGVSRASIDFRQADGVRRRIELRELAWLDLRPSMDKVSIYTRLFRGARLVTYWLRPRLFQALPKTSRGMRCWILLTLVGLVVWYGLAAAAAYAALTSLLPEPPEPGGQPSHGAPQIWDDVRTRLASIRDALPSAKLMGALAVVALGFKPLVDGIDVSWSTQSFMVDRDGLRRKLRLRLRGMLSFVGGETQAYRRILVVAHSFGTVVAADALGTAQVDDTALPPVHLVTLGSPLEFLTLCEPNLQGVVDGCLASHNTLSWSDFYALADAFCTRVPADPTAHPKFAAQEIEIGGSRLESALGLRHAAYFEHPKVLDLITGPNVAAQGRASD